MVMYWNKTYMNMKKICLFIRWSITAIISLCIKTWSLAVALTYKSVRSQIKTARPK